MDPKVIFVMERLPTELQMEIMSYIPINFSFQRREFEFFKNHLLHYAQNAPNIQNVLQVIPKNLQMNLNFMTELIEKKPEVTEYSLEPMNNDDCSTLQFTVEQFDYYRKFALKTVSKDCKLSTTVSRRTRIANCTSLVPFVPISTLQVSRE